MTELLGILKPRVVSALAFVLLTLAGAYPGLSFIPGPPGIPCSPSPQRFLLSWNISLLLLFYFFSATSSVNDSLVLQAAWLLLPQLAQHP